VALFCVAAALVSALVSADTSTSLLKVLSLFLLFLYGATGARLAILGRESKFIQGLLIGCEMLVYVSAIAYLGLGMAIWGNPNSLGAVMGVVIVPFLLWGVIVSGTRSQRYRRMTALLIAGTLLYISLSRASMLSAAVAVVALCVSLRQQRLLLQGTFVGLLFLASAAVLNPVHFDNFVRSVTSEVLHKGKNETGVLGSRLSPWQETVTVIQERPWFGSGFGTSYMGDYAARGSLDLSPSSGGLYTREGTNREHGNSYLALTEYVGLLGILPFALLVFLVARMIFQVCAWMRRNSSPYHCAIPLAMVLLAGLIHAFFEDWLTAVGYYLCLFFWTSAFLLQDMLPAHQPMRVPSASPAHPRVVHPLGVVVPNR
jgi:O-antigen ligase